MFVMPFPQIDPVLIQLGPLAIRWYALAYIAGLLGAWWYILRLLRDAKLWIGPPFQGKPQATAEVIGDLFVWSAVGVIIGGRLGYVAFYGLIYEYEYFAADWWRVFYSWKGGMSFHGGTIGVVLAVILFARRRSLDMVALGDLVAVAAPIGLFFGRIANFVNGELWGKPTDVPWAVIFPNPEAGGIPRHPSQLYEAALEGLVLFGILWLLVQRFQIFKRPGLAIAVFFFGYAIFRTVVESFFRENSHQSLLQGTVSMGTTLSLLMVAVAGFFYWYSMMRKGPQLLVK